MGEKKGVGKEHYTNENKNVKVTKYRSEEIKIKRKLKKKKIIMTPLAKASGYVMTEDNEPKTAFLTPHTHTKHAGERVAAVETSFHS